MSRVRWSWVLFLSLLLPARASAQAISGTVTDATGAVVPGVTVEAASPALIEKTRSTVTDGEGRYQILNLRPGTYTVTFTLSGFQTARRQDIILTQDFTAPVNVQLAVGGGTEVITVEATTPLVDVQNVSKPLAITNEMLAALPLGSRTIQDVLARVPGGGNGAFGQLTYRGSNDTLVTVDGNRTAWLNGPGPGSSSQALSAAAYQEYSFTPAIDNVESATGGVEINVVPKDGGNNLSGSVFGLYTGDNWSSDNRGDFAKPPFNLAAPAALHFSLDINPTVGGPILKDKLWYQNTAHIKRNDPVALGVYPDTNPDPWVYQGATSETFLAKETYYGGGTRLTWQASKKDKIAGFYDDQWYHWPNFLATAGGNPRSALNNVAPHQLNTGAKWTRVQSSNLLLEGGGSFFTLRLNNDTRVPAKEWSVSEGSVFKTSGLPVPTADIMPIANLSIGNPFFGGTAIGNQPETNSRSVSNSYTGNFAATYIHGAHTIKAGGAVLWGDTLALSRRIGDATLQLRNNFVTGQPQASQITAAIPDNTKSNIDGDWGFYVQDQWTRRRLTLKGSLRLDILNTSYPNQVQPGNVWLAEQNCSTNTQFCGEDVLNWKDLSPRASAAYDVFGNGRTAVKFGWARFVAAETTGLTGAVNPMGAIARTAITQWNDVDGNKTIYDASGNLQANELALPFTSTNFGTAVLSTTYDDDILRGWFKRGYTYETNVGIDHQVFSRLSASVTYYHRTQGNQTATDNVFTTPADYTGPFCLMGPTDSRIPGGGGQTVCGLFDITAAGRVANTLPQRNLVTFFDTLSGGKDRVDTRDGFDIELRTNLPGGAFVTGGFDIASTLTDFCGFSENPEDVQQTIDGNALCRNRTDFNVLPRISGSYTIPELDVFGAAKRIIGGIQISGNYAAVRGAQLQALWTANNCSPSNVTSGPFGPSCIVRFNDFAAAGTAGLPVLGRDLTFNPAAFSQQTKDIQLVAPGSEFLPYVHLFDMRFSKVVTFNRYRVTFGVDLYNAFNSNGVLNVNNSYGPTELAPGESRNYRLTPGGGFFGGGPFIPAPRQVRLNATFAF